MSTANVALVFVFGFVLLLNIVLVVRDRENAKEILALKSAQAAIQSNGFHLNRRSRRMAIDVDRLPIKTVKNKINQPLLEKIAELLPEALKLIPLGSLCICENNTIHWENKLNESDESVSTMQEIKKIRMVKGEKGERGPKGDTGPRGPKGDRGEKGFSLIEPQLKEADLNKTSVVSKNKTLMCKFFGNPIPSVEWAVKGNNHDIKTQIFESSSEVISHLTISNISFENHGSVSCRAKSILSQLEKTGFLDVQIKPAASVSKTIFYVNLGSNATFPACTVFANPPAKITWKKGFGEFSHSRSVQSGEGDFTIMDVRVEDEGFYVCTAENYLGSDSVAIQLKTNPLKVSYGPPSEVIVFNYPYTLSCGAFGQTKQMSGKWRSLSDGQYIDQITVISSNFYNITTKIWGNGVYTCEFSDGVSTVERVTMVKNFSLPSSIISNIEDQKKIYHLLKKKNIPTNSVTKCSDSYGIYRNYGMYQSNWMSNIFQTCYYQLNTLIVVKVSDGWIVGGFTDQPWSNTQYSGSASNKTFVFTSYDDGKIKTKDLLSLQICYKRSQSGNTYPCFGLEELTFEDQYSSSSFVKSNLLLGSKSPATVQAVEVFSFK